MRVAMLILLCSLIATNASASGYGLYFGTEPVVGRYEVNHDATEWNISAGLLIDSNVARNRLFNYRFALGYQYTRTDREGSLRDPFDDIGHGFSLNQSFGFGIIRSRAFRLWAGPAIRFAGSYHPERVIYQEVWAGAWYWLSRTSSAYGNFQLGIGPEVGINIHTGKIGSITLSGGYQFAYDVRFVSRGAAHSGAHLVFANLGFLFRAPGDVF